MLRAELAIHEKVWSEASEDLHRVRVLFSEEGRVFDLITVSLRLAWVLPASGDVAELRNLARQMSTLVDSLAKHRFLEAALTRFVRDAGIGEISLDVIDSISDP